MDESEFDRFADEYHAMHRQNIRASGEAPEFFAEYKIKDIHAELASNLPQAFLDFGGGVGSSLPFISKYFPACAITIADVSRRSLDIAQARNIPNAKCLHFDGATLPLEDASQDAILAACVFHHIPAKAHIGLFRELRRVLRPGGSLFVFEHNPWNPLTVHAVNTCPFDENAVLINAPELSKRVRQADFSRSKVNVRYRIFFPHLFRRLRSLERFLVGLPLGAQYYVRAEK